MPLYFIKNVAARNKIAFDLALYKFIVLKVEILLELLYIGAVDNGPRSLGNGMWFVT